MPVSRRDFLATTALGSVALALDTQTPAARRPIIISAHNGYNYLDDGYEMLRQGADTLDAALRVVRGPEDDPNDDSVGLGGLPNEEGVVELDACCMHGPTRRAGSVGAVRNIKNVSLVAKAVMEHTGHLMLVGEGAERFAVAQGFARENLLT
jgi:N4-(beta-N-acetylglucosaminyl)-L-asparaginase